jgi:hypothetical protein
VPLHRSDASRIDDIDDVLRMAQQLIDADQRALLESATGDEVSCRPGCTACCAQAVPVGAAELRAVAAAIDALPEAQRTRVAARIDDANNRLRSAGFAADDLTTAASRKDRHAISMSYFAEGVMCPLLEDGMCSVRAARPLACREFLVTSSPDRCATTCETTVVRLRSKRDILRSYGNLEWRWGDRSSYILALALAEPIPTSSPRSWAAPEVWARLSETAT